MKTNAAPTHDWPALDSEYVWHPYSAFNATPAPFPVVAARGCTLRLADGRELVDGMASWWCAIHGYNVPELNAAIERQLGDMAHVMFGGLTHEPAARLAQTLVELTPDGLEAVFFADSGSVSVEVALKMAVQYWQALGKPDKQQFVSLRGGYHGDTLGAMSVCDPVTGMHRLFNHVLMPNHFAERPACRFGERCTDTHIASLKSLLQQHGERIAALILEPVVQGAGGMWFYSADYLRRAQALCRQYDVLLIADEIATGFGRSGKLFACEHAGVTPDILCLGKALTGGYMTLAATLTSAAVRDAISHAPPRAFMHGPTFMANPLACRTALASIDLLRARDWQAQVAHIEAFLQQALAPCAELPQVHEVRVLGAIGVVELHRPVEMATIQPAFVEAGVWIRPFGKLVYLMPPYVIADAELDRLCRAIFEVIRRHHPASA